MLRKILKKKKVVTAKKGLSNEVYNRTVETEVYTGFFQISSRKSQFLITITHS